MPKRSQKYDAVTVDALPDIEREVNKTAHANLYDWYREDLAEEIDRQWAFQMVLRGFRGDYHQLREIREALPTIIELQKILREAQTTAEEREKRT